MANSTTAFRNRDTVSDVSRFPNPPDLSGLDIHNDTTGQAFEQSGFPKQKPKIVSAD